jgi:hypothetical protein
MKQFHMLEICRVIGSVCNGNKISCDWLAWITDRREKKVNKETSEIVVK